MIGDWQLQIVRQGEEQEPVVVIDRFAADPDRFIGNAEFLAFQPIGPHYPGIRAVVPDRLIAPFVEALAPVITEVFGLGAPSGLDAFYSIVTTAPADLGPIQRLPHFDGVEPGRLALLHYLSRDDRGGTAFYRHRSTGYETVSAERLSDYRQRLQRDIDREGLPGPAYIAGDTPIFEQIAVHDGRFNRAILYRSNTLHCALIPDDMSLLPDPVRGRFTVNTFLMA